MGLRDDIQLSVGAAFDEDLADVIAPLILRKQIGQGEYNHVTDSYDPLFMDYPSRGVAMPASSGQVMAGIALYTDETLMILGNEIAAIPEQGDEIILGGSSYRVLVNLPVAAGGTVAIVHNLVIRRND